MHYSLIYIAFKMREKKHKQQKIKRAKVDLVGTEFYHRTCKRKECWKEKQKINEEENELMSV